MINLYDNPEKFDLIVVGELNDPGANWSFDDLVVWQHDSGRLFYAQDSGCSCPSPFENLTEIESATEITKDSWASFADHVMNHAEEWDKSSGEFQCDKNQLMSKVAALLSPPTREEVDSTIANLKRLEKSLS